MKLTGMSVKQIELLDAMWSIQDMCDLEEWKQSLDEEDRKQAIVLQELLIILYIDEVVESTEISTEVQQIISKLK